MKIKERDDGKTIELLCKRDNFFKIDQKTFDTYCTLTDEQAIKLGFKKNDCVYKNGNKCANRDYKW